VTPNIPVASHLQLPTPSITIPNSPQLDKVIEMSEEEINPQSVDNDDCLYIYL
jgi:hypothetical protein